MTTNYEPRFIPMPKPLWVKEKNGKFVEIPYAQMRGCVDPAKDVSFYYIDPADSNEVKDFAMQHPRLFKHVFPGWLRLRTRKQSWLAYHLTSKRTWLLPMALAFLNGICAGINIGEYVWYYIHR